MSCILSAHSEILAFYHLYLCWTIMSNKIPGGHGDKPVPQKARPLQANPDGEPGTTSKSSAPAPSPAANTMDGGSDPGQQGPASWGDYMAEWQPSEDSQRSRKSIGWSWSKWTGWTKKANDDDDAKWHAYLDENWNPENPWWTGQPKASATASIPGDQAGQQGPASASMDGGNGAGQAGPASAMVDGGNAAGQQGPALASVEDAGPSASANATQSSLLEVSEPSSHPDEEPEQEEEDEDCADPVQEDDGSENSTDPPPAGVLAGLLGSVAARVLSPWGGTARWADCNSAGPDEQPGLASPTEPASPVTTPSPEYDPFAPMDQNPGPETLSNIFDCSTP